MWLFDRIPAAALKAAYGFVPEPAWLDHLRMATVQFGDEGTGCFAGREGLVLTNQHVAHAYLQRLSSPGRDLVKQGFLAADRAQELPVPGLSLRRLVSTEEITAEVERAVKPGMAFQEAEEARQAAAEGLRSKEARSTGLVCELATFRGGGERWIYRYETFQDVRLVMAPEYDVAAFGKEWDNFTYPRHDLDFALFRVYRDGRPFHPDTTLTIQPKGARSGELTFAAGHPGRTSREETLVELDYRRRVLIPLTVQTLERHLAVLTTFAARNAENARLVSTDLLETSNFLKVYREELRSLQDRDLWMRKQDREQTWAVRVRLNPELRTLAGGSWTAQMRLFERQEALAKEYQLLHRTFCSLERGSLYRALRLVRMITEARLEDAHRLEGRSDEERRAARQELAEPMSMNRELEALLLEAGLEDALAWLGADHPLVKALLAGSTPEKRADQAMQETRIDNPVFVADLLGGGEAALKACQDPLVLMARALDPRSREVKRQYEALETRIEEHRARLARARYAVEGREGYPEADFTLRLSYGTIKPYPASGTLQPPFTTLGGLFDRADAWGPHAEQGSWALPRRWLERRSSLDPSVPLNFITTHDITGGSSGSPVVNVQGELVGLVFDGNLDSIAGRFHYEPATNRCIAVDIRAILQALDKVYDAKHLVQELAPDASQPLPQQPPGSPIGKISP